jgi:uroporphyrinogen decarboxylase
MFCGRIDDLEYWLSGLGLSSERELRAHWGLDLQKISYSKAFRVPKGKTIWATDDEWDSGYSSARTFPLKDAETISDVEKHIWPDSSIVDFDIISEQIRSLDQDKARIASLGFQALLCTLFELFGMDTAMLNMYQAPELIEAVAAHIEAFLLGSFKIILDKHARDIDFFWWGDDFSTQRGMMISPEMWRKFLKPTYLRVFELIRAHGVMVWFHSCGSFAPVLGELVDGGINVWETVQAHLEGNEPEQIKQTYGNRLTFFGAINCQKTLPFGNPDDVRKDVRERFSVLGKNGGYIVGPDHSIQKNMPIANLEALFDEAHKCVYG